MRNFYHVLANTTVSSVVNFTVWFALTYFVYLETLSVFATSIIAGIYLVLSAATGVWFGSIVDHNKKKHVLLASSIISLVIYCVGFAVYLATPAEVFKNPSHPLLWIFVTLLMVGVMIGNIRNIVLPTLVTLLVPEDRRDKANGLVGTTSGISFLIVTMISGFLVGFGGMYYVFLLALVMSVIAIFHLLVTQIDEKKIVHAEHAPANIDLKGTFKVVSKIPGLFALILFTTFNNFLGGVFMALMDAYGLSLVSVQMWGVIWGVLSTAFIIGGTLISKYGLGENPLRTMFLANIVIWCISSVFTIYPSIILLAAGMFIYLCIVPYIEASEHTIIQKLVPADRQGRVFGFAQSVEQAASPLTAFAIGPITQFFFIPFMTTGEGVNLIGSWFGTGPDRGIALVFTITGFLGLAMTVLAMSSRFYKELSNHYLSVK